MEKSITQVAQAENPEPDSVRVSVTIPIDDYADLKKAASNKRVSIAWMVRDAVHDYLKNKTPLLGQ